MTDNMTDNTTENMADNTTLFSLLSYRLLSASFEEKCFPAREFGSFVIRNKILFPRGWFA